MIDLGLSARERKALVRTLARNHEVTASVGILDAEGRYLSTVGDRLLSGQVNIDATAEVTRQLQITFLDARRQVEVDTDDGSPDLSRMVRAYYIVYVEEVIGDWVWIPVFHGPITRVSRDGEIVSLEAAGKESLATGPVWRTRSYKKGSRRVWVIRSLMRDLTGEHRFKIPKGWRARLARPLSIKKDSTAWGRVQSVAHGMRAQAFYDGRGVLRVRKYPVRSLFTFRDGNGGMLLSTPKVEDSSDTAINLVRVTGATPEGKKQPLVATEPLPKGHPYSPQKLGRNGVKRYLPEELSDDTLRSQKEVDRAAKRRIKEIQMDEKMVTFDALPMPLLEELDPFVVDADKAKVTVKLSKMTIPLGHDGVSTFGYLAPVSKRRR